MGITIKDVAGLAGVSTATVSRVLNHKGPVHVETRRRVEEAVRQLRFLPNSAARILSTSKTNVVGLLLPDSYGEFYSDVIRGVDRQARSGGYQLLVASLHGEPHEAETALAAMVGRIDGLIVMAQNIDVETIMENILRDVPVVLLNHSDEDGRFDAFRIDNYGGAQRMVRHLCRRGHQRVAIIHGPPHDIDARERLAGYRAALAAEKLDEDGLVVEGDFTEASGYEAALRLLELPVRPTAVFASNDSMAIGAMRAFLETGLKVPDDVAVAGFDDLPVARFVTPSLSSVHAPICDLGAEAMIALHDAIRSCGGHVRRHRVLPTHLVIRESTGGYLANDAEDVAGSPP